MKQHGFARNRPWTASRSSDTSVTFELASDERTRAAYPWDFALAYRYSLTGTELRIDQHIENRSNEPMPFAAGFHPYFYMNDADKGRARIPTNATRGWDNVGKRTVEVREPIDLTAREVDLHLFDHRMPDAALERGDGTRVVVSASKEYARWGGLDIAATRTSCASNLGPLQPMLSTPAPD